MTCYTGFGNLADGRPFWIGDFYGSGMSSILFYYPGDDNWWLGTINPSDPNRQLVWLLADNTAGFGHAINDGRPFWKGRFAKSPSAPAGSAPDRDQILFYSPADDNWWLGTWTGLIFRWTSAGNTAGFGHAINDGRPFWTGRFTRTDRDQILFYYPGDNNWWLGTHDDQDIKWEFVGNTGFGQINDGRPFWIGKFTASSFDEILFYSPGDDNWWLGSLGPSGGKIKWNVVSNTSGFGHAINDGRPFWVGDFYGTGVSSILFYYPGDDNWWLGTVNLTDPNRQLTWLLADNTAGFGHAINDGRPFWVGRFASSPTTPPGSLPDRDQILFYSPADDNWWLGTWTGLIFRWTSAGNTAGFGHAINDGRPFWIGRFTQAARDEIVFYYPGDGNWWIGGSVDPGPLQWGFLGNTGRPCAQSVRLHFKSLRPLTAVINTYLNDQFDALQDLFSRGGVAVYRGTTEDLSGNAALAPLLNVNVGGCFLDQALTTDQASLFANRNNASSGDIIAYLVSSLIGGSGNLVGCANRPSRALTFVQVGAGSRWLLAHEAGHVLGLPHVDATIAANADRLMWPNISWTNVPPDLVDTEYTTMLGSNLTADC